MSSDETTLPDVELYDPIAKKTFGGNRTWCELRVDYLWGETEWGANALDIGGNSHMKYWVHGIKISDSEFRDYSIKVGQLFLIQSKDQTFPGVMAGFVQETALDFEAAHTYSFTFVPINMLDFVAALNGIITERKYGTKE